MPDIPNRSDEEAALAYLLMTMFQQQQADALSLLGDPPDARRIPPTFYDDMRRDLALATAAYLARIHAEAAGRMADQLGFDADAERALEAAEEWSTRRAGELSDQLVARVQAQVSDVIASAQEAEPDQQLAVAALGLATIWTTARAERIAIYETTGAASAGEMDQRDSIEDLYNVEIAATWNTQEDANVCEICEPFNGEPEEVWGHLFPSGPSAHGGCRCYLTWEVV